MINYQKKKSNKNDIERLIEYKKETTYEYATNLTLEEKNEIDKYLFDEVKEKFDYYYNIVVNNKVVGCLLLTNNDNGKLLDELYLEEEYRNNKIGTDIIKNILNRNDVVYLWVYKLNTKAISLYKRLGFQIMEETETRYYMKYSRVNNEK